MTEEKQDHFFTELLKFALVAAAIVIPVRLYVAQPFIVSGASMDPTFETGQYLIVDELSYHFEEPKRGEVVIFHYPKDPKQFFIKRIIGLPGETVKIENGEVKVIDANGKTTTLIETYIKNQGNGSNMTKTLGTGEYFVMGDNRPESSDSRSWGVLPEKNIVGRAFLRLLPVQTIGILPGSTKAQ
jgi:signal peptidase I